MPGLFVGPRWKVVVALSNSQDKEAKLLPNSFGIRAKCGSDNYAIHYKYGDGTVNSPRYVCSMSSGSTLQRYLFWVKPPMEFNMTKNCAYSIPCSCGKIYKSETGLSLKVRLEEHRKAVVLGEIEKLGMTDHIWKEKGNHLPLWDKVKIIDRAEHWYGNQ